MKELAHLFTEGEKDSISDLARSYLVVIHVLSGSIHLVLKPRCLGQCLAHNGLIPLT